MRPGGGYLVQPGQLHLEHPAVQKQQSGSGLGLGRGRDVSLNGQMAEELAYLQSAKLLRVALAVKEDKAPSPVDVGLLGPVRVVQCPDAVPQPVEQADRGGRA